MRAVVKWTVIVGGTVLGGAVLYSWAIDARRVMERGLDDAEAIAEETRSTLQQAERAIGTTEQALHHVRRG